MDRRRLEDAHLKFAVLQVVSWYPETLQFGEVDLSSDVNDCLERFTGMYYSHFSKKYAGKWLIGIRKVHGSQTCQCNIHNSVSVVVILSWWSGMYCFFSIFLL